jgi:nucleotide-binding universal stress UspA family protein
MVAGAGCFGATGRLPMSQRPEIKTILIPVDGSEHSRKAALVGALIAAKFGARVILLHVLLHGIPLAIIDELARTYRVAPEALDTFKKASPAVYDFGLTVPASVIRPTAPADLLLEIGRRILETEKAAVEGQGVKAVDLVLADDDPAREILEVAKREHADFIVLGRRGLGALQGMLSGSVSTKVSHHATATVVSVT